MPTIRIAKPTDAKGILKIYVHERLAFHHFATYEKAGYKLGKGKMQAGGNYPLMIMAMHP